MPADPSPPSAALPRTRRRRTRTLIIYALIAGLLATLLYFQMRAWTTFNWSVFLEQTRRANLLMILLGVASIYGAHLLRAVRWSLLLKPVRDVPFTRLISPTLIGFTGLALLGRPGEFMRPYLIARREKLSVSSQMAVWWVERIFDAGSLGLLLALSLLYAPALRQLPYFEQMRWMGLFFLVLVLGMTAGALLLRYAGHRIGNALERAFTGLAPRFAHRLGGTARAFGEGLNTIHDVGTFVKLVAVSVATWVLIGSSYVWVLHAYPAPLASVTPGGVVLLIGFSMVGSLAQLPAIGGGPQLAIIGALIHIFRIPPEMAVSAGIVIWLVNLMSVVPAGLVLARRQHVSLRKLSEESEEEEEKAEEELEGGVESGA
jgi:uncharacterized protein (TIRG00374 family)